MLLGLMSQSSEWSKLNESWLGSQREEGDSAGQRLLYVAKQEKLSVRGGKQGKVASPI